MPTVRRRLLNPDPPGHEATGSSCPWEQEGESRPGTRVDGSAHCQEQGGVSHAWDEDPFGGAARRLLPLRPARAGVCRSSAGVLGSRPERARRV